MVVQETNGNAFDDYAKNFYASFALAPYSKCKLAENISNFILKIIKIKKRLL
jgi:hypothetical protein